MALLLNIVIYLPIVGILGILLTRSDKSAKWISLLATGAAFILSLPLLFNFDIANSATQQYLTTGGIIIPGLDIKYLVGLDGFSLLLFMLTTLFGPIVVLYSWGSVTKHLQGYYAMILLLQTASMGFFAALDLVVFYLFFEISLMTA